MPCPGDIYCHENSEQRIENIYFRQADEKYAQNHSGCGPEIGEQMFTVCVQSRRLLFFPTFTR